jgi:hypothetical protein
LPDYSRAIERAARRHGVDPRILLAQLRQESGLNPNAVSRAGARGIAQFMPGTAKSMGVNLHDGRAADDIDGAARLMAQLLKQFGGSYEKALRGYNAGPGNVERSKSFPETNHYVEAILGKGGRRPPDTPRDVDGAAPRAQNGSTTRTLPGVDRSAERQQAKIDYFSNHSPDALIQLALSLRGLKDTPGRTIRTPGGGRQRRANGPDRATIRELFYNGPGGVNIKDGKRVGKGFVDGHTDHVHVATQSRRGAIRLGELAERLGLTVREQSHFDPVDPVHAEGSYHDSDRAIDVSGDPELMRQFARRVARRRKNR